jgi:hypothetical protein
MSSVFFLTNRAERIDEIDALVALTTPELRARHRLPAPIDLTGAAASGGALSRSDDRNADVPQLLGTLLEALVDDRQIG